MSLIAVKGFLSKIRSDKALRDDLEPYMKLPEDQMLPMAVRTFEQAVEKAPRNPTYHFHLGLAHAKAGEDAKARKALEQALKLSPKFNGADEARKVLAKLVY